VDGLHRRAGGRNVLELHGSILRTRCSAEGLPVEPARETEGVPPCPNCGAPLRPDVVWFGEALPEAELAAATEAVRTCDLFLSIGTSSLVYPAAALPYDARSAGATVVEVNPDQTPLTEVADFALPGKAGEILRDLCRQAFGRPPHRPMG
jgi:NAD-dependent deacetylase